jgi:hypothetical protein
MAKIISATLAGIPVSSLDFQLVLGVDPGTGSVTIPGIGHDIPYLTSIVLSDNENTYTLNNIYVTAVRHVLNSTGGTDTVCSIADFRVAWKYGYINGIFNEEDYRGVPKREKTLVELLEYIFSFLTGTTYYFFGLPTVYPEVVWEFENPAQALNELCDKYQLCVGYDIVDNGRIIVCPLNYERTLPNLPKMSEEVATKDLLLPNKIILVGDREIRQVTFEGLIPVGEDLDGSVKPINQLSYAPVGAGGGSEAYPYQLWGEEIRTCFQNLDTEQKKELAEKSVFKWYRINGSKYPLDNVLPLLNDISELEIVEGITDHAKPYVLGEITEWTGHEFVTKPKGKLTDGYQIDKKLGMVTFNEPKVKSRATGPNSEGFTAPVLDLVAAYERYDGLDTDFITFYSLITGGVLPPAVHKETSLVGWYKQTSPAGTLFENLTFELLNQVDVFQYANEVLAQIYSQYITVMPKTIRYPGLYLVGAYGTLKQVIVNFSASDGVETEYQYGLEIPKLHIKNYEEKLNAKFIDKNLKQQAKEKRKRARQQSIGKGKRQKRENNSNNVRDKLIFYRKNSKDVRIVKNVHSADFAPNDLVKVVGYNSTDKVLEVTLIDDGAKVTAIAPEGIKAGKKGVIILDGAGVVKKNTGDSIAVGDRVKGESGSTKCVKDVAGEFIVTKVDANNVYVEKTAQSSGGSGDGNIYAIVVKSISYVENNNLNSYTVRLLSDTTPIFPTGSPYAIGAMCISAEDGFKYISSIEDNTNSPESLIGWSLVGDELIVAKAWHEKDAVQHDLRDLVPWFKENEIVRIKEDSENPGEWYINETLSYVQDEEYASIRWSETYGKLRAVVV